MQMFLGSDLPPLTCLGICHAVATVRDCLARRKRPTIIAYHQDDQQKNAVTSFNWIRMVRLFQTSMVALLNCEFALYSIIYDISIGKKYVPVLMAELCYLSILTDWQIVICVYVCSYECTNALTKNVVPTWGSNKHYGNGSVHLY